MPQKNSALQVFKGGWEELQNAVFTDNISPSVLGQPISMFIKPDGTKLFTLNTTGNVVETRSLSIPYDIATIGSVEDTFNITVDGDPRGITFSPDGTIMVVVGSGMNRLFSFVLPTPWVPSSIVDFPTELGTLPVTGIEQCTFTRDGDFIYVTNNIELTSYPLSTNFDITSAGTSTTFDPGAFDVDSVAVKPEGDLLYIGHISGNGIRTYSMSTLNDITTASDIGVTKNLSATPIQEPTTIQIRTNGKQIFVLGSFTDQIIRMDWDEQWNISSASYFANEFSSNNANERSLAWNPNGLEFFTINATSDLVSKFTSSDRWNISSASSTPTQTFSIQTEEGQPQAMYWRKDGLRFYIGGQQNDRVQEYILTTAFDFTTISVGITFTPDSSSNIYGIYFSDDGLNLFLMRANGFLSKHILTTSFDLTTANSTPAQTQTLDSGNDGLRDLFFSPDGIFMYIPDQNNDLFTLRRLRQPFDISTIIETTTLDVSSQLNNPNGIFIREQDGKKIIACNSTGSGDNVISFDMSLEFNFNLINNLGEDLITNADENIVYQ